MTPKERSADIVQIDHFRKWWGDKWTARQLATNLANEDKPHVRLKIAVLAWELCTTYEETIVTLYLWWKLDNDTIKYTFTDFWALANFYKYVESYSKHFSVNLPDHFNDFQQDANQQRQKLLNLMTTVRITLEEKLPNTKEELSAIWEEYVNVFKNPELLTQFNIVTKMDQISSVLLSELISKLDLNNLEDLVYLYVILFSTLDEKTFNSLEWVLIEDHGLAENMDSLEWEIISKILSLVNKLETDKRKDFLKSKLFDKNNFSTQSDLRVILLKMYGSLLDFKID